MGGAPSVMAGRPSSDDVAASAGGASPGRLIAGQTRAHLSGRRHTRRAMDLFSLAHAAAASGGGGDGGGRPQREDAGRAPGGSLGGTEGGLEGGTEGGMEAGSPEARSPSHGSAGSPLSPLSPASPGGGPPSPAEPADGPRADSVCHACRMRKLGCNRALPICSRCAKAGSVCAWVRGGVGPGGAGVRYTEMSFEEYFDLRDKEEAHFPQRLVACDNCRSRKRRCKGGKPGTPCAACLRFGTPCLFEGRGKKAPRSSRPRRASSPPGSPSSASRSPDLRAHDAHAPARIDVDMARRMEEAALRLGRRPSGSDNPSAVPRVPSFPTFSTYMEHRAPPSAHRSAPLPPFPYPSWLYPHPPSAPMPMASSYPPPHPHFPPFSVPTPPPPFHPDVPLLPPPRATSAPYLGRQSLPPLDPFPRPRADAFSIADAGPPLPSFGSGDLGSQGGGLRVDSGVIASAGSLGSGGLQQMGGSLPVQRGWAGGMWDGQGGGWEATPAGEPGPKRRTA
ncbi:hypothetical protein DFJ74DRAFT_679750 [Hyaloraphidium curvatum]|nr:hypothetical protein DFJ74DRAFT_679750 [Hyaloraphidium curvatum]